MCRDVFVRLEKHRAIQEWMNLDVLELSIGQAMFVEV